MDHFFVVKRGNLYRAVRAACRRAADEERKVEPFALHLGRDVHHFVERGGDQTGQADHVHPVGAGLGEDLFAGDHDPEVDHLVAVAGQNDADDVFADVVDIAFDRGHEDLALGAGIRVGRALALHVRGEPGDGALHHARTLDHLREEHFPLAEQIADNAHAVHQGAFDHIEGPRILLPGLFRVLVDVVDNALDQGVGQAVLDRSLAPLGVLFGGRFALALHRLGKGDQPLGRVGTTVEQDVFDQFEKIRRNLGIDPELTGIDDPHVEARFDRVVKECGVHRLAHRVVPAETEGDIAHPATDPRIGQVFFDPARGLDEINRVIVVLLDAGRHGEDVRVKNDVLGRETNFFDQDAVST